MLNDECRYSESVIVMFSLFVLYSTTFFQRLILYSVECRGEKLMMNWKGFGRKWLWPSFKVLS